MAHRLLVQGGILVQVVEAVKGSLGRLLDFRHAHQANGTARVASEDYFHAVCVAGTVRRQCAQSACTCAKPDGPRSETFVHKATDQPSNITGDWIDKNQ